MSSHSPSTSLSLSPPSTSSSSASSTGGARREGDKKRQPLQPGDLTPGCVVWLASRASLFHRANTSADIPWVEQVECIGTARCLCSPYQHDDAAGCAQGRETWTRNEILPTKGYNHPAVILQIHQRAGSRIRGDVECVVATITSFSGTSLQTYLNYSSLMPDTIPIAHPPYQHGLALEPRMGDDSPPTLLKQSYVRIDHIYTVPLPYLRTFSFHPRCRAYKLRLSEPSYAVLMDFLHLPPQPWVDAHEIWETAAGRLDAWLKLGIDRDGHACAAENVLAAWGDESVVDVEHDKLLGVVPFSGCVVDDGLTYGTTYTPPVLLSAEPTNDDSWFPMNRKISLGKNLGSAALISVLGIYIWHFQF
ncbi:hypothetical protein PVAG01_06991 [Phlyctema vagabunda]|uniref:Uncharacterized protein n=1 Tax=Phlyctema vagabunda TaxID=108571 RepID=A0ABR4PBX5_9HELO